MPPLTARALAALLLLHVSASAGTADAFNDSDHTRVVELTELNFDEHVPGSPPSPWLIDIMAPWCPACQDLEPVWEALADELHPDGIKVGRIDGTTEKGLLTRFSVQHFPSIYHINGTETREYSGGRTLKKLAHFAREGWREVEPRTRCSSPVTRCGRLLGRVTRIPAQVRQYYRYLHDQKKYSDLTLVAGLLAVPVAIGMTFICLLDAYYTRQPMAPATPPRKRRKFDPLTPPPPASEFPPYEPKDYFRFEIIHRSKKSDAKVGRIHTPHGVIDTPGFVAVATNGALKAVDISWADAEGLQLMFCNTYHLMLHPGPEVVAAAGGLHTFMNRNRPLITDSGGFQVFSLCYGTVHEEVNHLKRSQGPSKHKEGNLVTKISEDGVTFRSYRDGSRMLLTPESSVLAQKAFGADIIIPLDELPPYHMPEADVEASLARSHRWMARSLRTHLEDPRQQAMYGIIHGGMCLELRRRSIEYMTSLPFDGFAMGGALGKNRDELFWLLKQLMPLMPSEKPLHVLGIADPNSIPELVTYGCDTFDSCYPTRAGRHGTMLTPDGPLRVVSGKYKTAFRPPVEGCSCHTCSNHSLAYLHHLFKANEPLGPSLLTIHNIHFMAKMMEQLRQRILNDEL